MLSDIEHLSFMLMMETRNLSSSRTQGSPYGASVPCRCRLVAAITSLDTNSVSCAAVGFISPSPSSCPSSCCCSWSCSSPPLLSVVSLPSPSSAPTSPPPSSSSSSPSSEPSGSTDPLSPSPPAVIVCQIYILS